MLRRSSLERKVAVRHNASEDFADDDEWKGSDASEDDENESDDTENEWSNNLNATEPSEENGVDGNNDDNVGEEVEEIEIEIEIETKKPASVPKKKKFVPKKKSISACSKGDLVPLAIRPKKKRKNEFVIDKEGEDDPSCTRKRKKSSTEEDDVDDDDSNYNVKRGEIEIETKKPASVPKKKKFVPEKKSISACSKGDLVPLMIRPKKKRKNEFVIDKEGEDTPSCTRKRKKSSYSHTEEDDVDDDDRNYNVERGEIEIEKKKPLSVPKEKKFIPKKNSSILACSKGDLVPLTKNPKKRKKKEFLIDEGVDTSSYARKTKHGGYLHTNLSKSRISTANSGNKPWNYGKRRSSADKAKIAAGVRAINRTRLLAKLQRLGMTEEEWSEKKKQIKYLRERIRRAKKANLKVETEFHLKKLQETMDTTDETKRNKNGIKVGEPNYDNNEEQIGTEKERKKKIAEQEKNEIQEERTKKSFSEVSTCWRPYSFSENKEMDNNNSLSYGEVCDEGGPGGLICCEDCSRNYNVYLTNTMEDVEMQRINKEAEEVTEILDYLNEKKEILNQSVDYAKTKIPPLPPPGSRIMQVVTAPKPRPSNFSSKSESNSKYDHIDSEIDINVGDSWNLTSAIDIGVTGGFFASI